MLEASRWGQLLVWQDWLHLVLVTQVQGQGPALARGGGGELLAVQGGHGSPGIGHYGKQASVMARILSVGTPPASAASRARRKPPRSFRSRKDSGRGRLSALASTT